MRVILTRSCLLLALVVLALGTGRTVLAQEACDKEATAQEVTAPVEAVVVSMQQDRFNPEVLTVAAGTAVTWSNDEADPTNAHNVISLIHGIESPYIYPGEVWSYTFDVPGEYDYFCDLHEGMFAKVIVE
jgi:plastocyanin